MIVPLAGGAPWSRRHIRFGALKCLLLSVITFVAILAPRAAAYSSLPWDAPQERDPTLPALDRRHARPVAPRGRRQLFATAGATFDWTVRPGGGLADEIGEGSGLTLEIPATLPGWAVYAIADPSAILRHNEPHGFGTDKFIERESGQGTEGVVGVDDPALFVDEHPFKRRPGEALEAHLAFLAGALDLETLHGRANGVGRGTQRVQFHPLPAPWSAMFQADRAPQAIVYEHG